MVCLFLTSDGWYRRTFKAKLKHKMSDNLQSGCWLALHRGQDKVWI